MTAQRDRDLQIGRLQNPDLVNGTIEIFLDKGRGQIIILCSDDPHLYLQCVHYRKTHSRVGLYVLFNDHQEPVEYENLVGIENMAAWKLSRDLARRESEAERCGRALQETTLNDN